MITGTTKTGFEYEIEEEVLDDWTLLRKLCEVDAGNLAPLPECLDILLGPEQEKKLEEHCKSKKSGRVLASKMIAEMMDIFNSNKQGKNS